MSDSDALDLMKNAYANLNIEGLLVIKVSLATNFDCFGYKQDDQQVTRPEAFYLDLFKSAGLKHFKMIKLDIDNEELNLEPEVLFLFKKEL